MHPSESDQLLIERIRAGESAAWDELIARFEGRLTAYVESRTRNRADLRRFGARDVHRLSHEPAEFRQAAAVGELSVLHRRAQADRSSAARRAAADVAVGARREQRQRLGAGRARAARPAASPAAANAAGSKKTPSSRCSASRSSIGKSRGNGIKSSAPNCSSSAAGRTRKSPTGWASPNKRWPITNSNSSPNSAPPSAATACRKRFFRNFMNKGEGGRGKAES